MSAKRAMDGSKAGKKAVAAAAGDEAAAESRAVRHKTPLVRRSMLEAAASLFAERGFAGTSLKDVADVLGISRPGLYYHFSSKEKLLEAIIEEVTISGVRQLEYFADIADADPEEALRLVVATTTLWVLDHHILFRVLDRSETEMPVELREVNNASKKAMLGYFTCIIERGIEVGKFRPIDPYVAALTISGMRNWTAWWFKPDGRLSSQEISETIADMAVRSVLRPDVHRSRSDRVSDVLRILKDDVAHLSQLLGE